MEYCLTDRQRRKKIFKSHVLIDSNGCWIYQTKPNISGYCTSSIDSKSMGAHRASYILFKGDIPEGLVVDHLCNVKRCVNPDHLEAKTQAENLKRVPNWGRNHGRNHTNFCEKCSTKLTYHDGQKRCMRCRDKWLTEKKLQNLNLPDINESLIEEHQKLKTNGKPTYNTSLFVQESIAKFGNNFKVAVKLKLFTLGYTTHSRTVVQAFRYLDKALQTKVITMDDIAKRMDLPETKTKLRKKLDGVLTD